jgi:uncharacterized protein YciI
MKKKYFMLRLNPPRVTFGQDMTMDEQAVMQKHIAYWTKLMNNGYAIVFGPVIDPKGVYGLAVITAESVEQVEVFIKNDPANGLNQYEYCPMIAVVPG